MLLDKWGKIYCDNDLKKIVNRYRTSLQLREENQFIICITLNDTTQPKPKFKQNNLRSLMTNEL